MLKSETAFTSNSLQKKEKGQKGDPFPSEHFCRKDVFNLLLNEHWKMAGHLLLTVFPLVFLPCSSLQKYPANYSSMQGSVDCHTEEARCLLTKKPKSACIQGQYGSHRSLLPWQSTSASSCPLHVGHRMCPFSFSWHHLTPSSCFLCIGM